MNRFILLILFNVLALNMALGADELAQAQDKLNEIASSIGKIEKSIAKNIRDHAELQADMLMLDKQIGGLHQEITRLNKKAAKASKKAAELDEKDKALQGELASHGDALKQQVRMAYLSQQQNKWKLILSQDSLQTAGRISIMYDYINNSRVQQIRDINDLAFKIRSNQRQLKQERAKMEKLIAQQSRQARVLQGARTQKERAQVSLDQLIEEDRNRLKREQKNRKAIKKLVAKLQKQHLATPSGKFTAQKGRLIWPVKGRLLNRYGAAKEGSTDISWDGVSIQAPKGTDIKAVFSGQVVFSDWLQGYGWLLIIDHGDSFMSLYAHAEGLSKEVGDTVQRGETVGLVGDSGGATQSMLYFEIRRQGAPVDPSDWCKQPKLAYSVQ